MSTNGIRAKGLNVAGKASGAMKISVAMTTYNGERFLGEQLDSIFAQTRLPDEIIICDDRSSDATTQILREHAARAPCPMTVIVNDENLGSTKNFEKVVSLCSGDVIALCDQDDVWRPQKLAVLQSAFADDPQLGVALTNADLIDEYGKLLSRDLWARARFNDERQQALNSSRRYDLLFGLPFATGATMSFRSRYRSLVLPFPQDAPTFIHDRWIAILIAAVGHMGIIPDKLIAYRLHPKQQLGVGPPLFLKAFVPHKCRSDAVALAALAERLRQILPSVDNCDFWRSLRERQLHIAVRSSFSRNPLRRLKQVAFELRSGRYNRYPFGLLFAAKDFLVGTQ